MLVERRQICKLIPHSGNMCLIDAVVRWDEQSILCVSRSHQKAANPLRTREKLSSIHAIEYGAQAMAIHGGLLAQRSTDKPRTGHLAALKDVLLHVEYLHHLEESLTINAEQLAVIDGSLMYSFDVFAGEQSVASARATVITQPHA